jgi:hypothetical protein
MNIEEEAMVEAKGCNVLFYFDGAFACGESKVIECSQSGRSD